MSALRSAIEELGATETASLTYGELRDDVCEIARAIDRLTAQLQRRTAEVARRGDYGLDGFVNPTRWLAVTADMADSVARRHVSAGETLNETMETARRFHSGELSWWRANQLAKAAAAHPETFERDEELLLGFADDLSHRDFPRAIRYWTHCADQEAAEEEAASQRDSAYLHASATSGGMVRLDAMLDSETGEIVLSALEAATPPPGPDDSRPRSRRRVDALGEICRQWLQNGTTSSGGIRPHVNLIVDYETLLGRMGRRCELDHTGTISPETARRILCDASVSRVITRGDSEPLDMGRATRTVTAAQRRALVIRDGGCRFPGCDRPPAWCDAHHITHWLNGGPTDLLNLLLLCRRHHTLVHEGAFTVSIREGVIQIE